MCPRALRADYNFVGNADWAGGLELGLRLAVPDAHAVCYVEGEAYVASLLVAHMEAGRLDPAPVWSDVRTFDGTSWRGTVDCITAGYPCQPFSIAGRKRAEQDPRHLWPIQVTGDG